MNTTIINTLRAFRVFAGLACAGLACTLLGLAFVPAGVSAQAVAARGSELLTEPLPADRTAGNAALFAGIGAFADSESGLNPLRYAPADVIALAHLFTQELKLVPPQRAWLALSYAPDSLPPAAQAQLATLKASGVNLLVADKSCILAQLSRISRMADNPDDAILVTFSSHGYEKEGQAYLMPRDGLRQHLRDTGIALDSITTTLQDSRAGKKIMIIDACRELPPGAGSATRGDDAMSAGLQQAFIAAKGVARLISCKAQQQSWEAPDLQLGVYTHFLIETLRGRAKPDDQGYIRLGSVLQYASASTEAWVKRNRGREQTPWSECDEQARDIPLAVSTATREALDSLQKRRGSALELLEAARREDRERISAVMVDEVDKASRQWTGKPLDDLLDQLELLHSNTPAARANFARYWADAGGAAAREAEARRQEEARQLAEARRRADEADRLRKEAEERARQAEEARRAAVAAAAREDARPPTGGSAYSSNMGGGQARTVDLGGGVSLEMVPVKAGSFQMGSDEGSSDEKPVRTVRISRDFWMGKYEVTNGEYQRFVREAGYDGSSEADGDYLRHHRDWGQYASTADTHPIVAVSWNNAMAFCRWLTERERAANRLPQGDVYRLPTEAEWEYAARGGAQGRGYTYAGGNDINTVAWYSSNSGGKTQRVGTKTANELGLHDMSGNVWEWVNDWYQDSYNGLGTTEPTGPANGSIRVLRGGGWFNVAAGCRSALRYRGWPSDTRYFLGFRVVLAPVP